MRYRSGRLIQSGMAALLLIPATSVACTCADPGQISEDKVIDAMCAVDVVFVGKATDLISRNSHARILKIDPITVFKGDLARPVVARTSTTCDQWYTPNDNYLIFGNIEAESNNLSTSICGPTRFTGKVENAQFQLKIIDENVAGIDQLCGSAESGARQIRIIRQDRIDAEAYEVEALRLLKEGLGQSRVDYEQALEDTESILEEED